MLMCNRYNTPDEIEMERHFKVGRDAPNRWWNTVVTPLAPGPYITPAGLVVGQWGMIPRNSDTRRPKAKDGKPLMTNNARDDRMAKSWTFAPSWTSGRRCIIPAAAWVEPYWGLKTKSIWWAIRRADGRPAALAGLYSEWTDPQSGEIVPNFTMITQAAGGHPLLSQMHRPGKEKRSVVLLEQEDWDVWLHGTVDQADSLIKLPAPGLLVSGAEKPEEEDLLPPEQLQMLRAAS